jgi:hypothetical protein
MLEFQEGLPRADAERQALAELAARLRSDSLRQRRGILGELIAAEARRQHPQLVPALAALGLIDRRTPAWGVGHIIPDGTCYRAADSGEAGSRAALIAPATEEGTVADLVSQDLETGRLRSRLDVAALVGLDAVEAAKAHGLPLVVFRDLAQWIRSDCRGAVVIRWSRAGEALDGVPAVLSTADLAARLHNATSKCWPRPVIAVPEARSARHAA